MRATNSWLLVVLVALGGCGPRTFKQRLIDAERRAGEAERALDDAEEQMRALEPDAAQERLELARSSLSNPDTEFYPERQMIQDRLKADEGHMPAVRAARAKRDLERAVEEQRRKALARLEQLRAALGAAKTTEARASEFDALRSSIDSVTDQLQDGQPLELKHGPYARFAAQSQKELDAAREVASFLKAKIAFLDGPGALYAEARAAQESARAEKERARRRELNTQALELFGRCTNEGKERLKATPALERTSVVVAETALSGGSLIERCAERQLALERLIRKAKPEKKAVKAPKKRRR